MAGKRMRAPNVPEEEQLGVVDDLGEPIGTVRTLGSPGTTPLKREMFRGWMTVALLSCLMIMFVLTFLYPPQTKEVWSMVDKISSALITLLGTAVGFYFRRT